MPQFSFYPTRADGVSLTFETAEFASEDAANLFAQDLLLRHETADEVVIFVDWQDKELSRARRATTALMDDLD